MRLTFITIKAVGGGLGWLRSPISAAIIGPETDMFCLSGLQAAPDKPHKQAKIGIQGKYSVISFRGKQGIKRP
eukprot:scaffold235899_cov49-Prasinocladus_malaysianus.AAC.1